MLKKISIPLLVIGLSSCASMPKENIHKPQSENSAETSNVNESPSLKEENSGKVYLKRKVAISRFTNETTYGQSFLVDGSNNRIGKQAMDIMSSKLFETGKFIMIERADLDKIEKELEISGSTGLKNSADFIILGSITEFGRKTTSDVGVFSRTKRQEAHASVNIRLVDVSTGQIIYTEEGSGKAYSDAGTTFGVGDKAGYDTSLNDKAITAAITNLASNLIENMLGKPWRSYILGYEDGNVIISGGESQNILPGTKLNVMKKGKKVKNPQTNMEIVLPGKKIGSIEVIKNIDGSAENEVSFATIVDGELSGFLSQQDFSEIYIEAGDSTL